VFSFAVVALVIPQMKWLVTKLILVRDGQEVFMTSLEGK